VTASALHAPAAAPRGVEASRIAGFSDAVFGFALTLLVVALEVPRSYADLVRAMNGFIAFAASFAILLWIWYEHARFFRRYPIGDGPTIVLNGLLLFVVLFYVYPLKFMFTMLSASLLGIGGPEGAAAPPGVTLIESRSLLAIYGAGFVAVFSILALMYRRALRMAESLHLDAAQRHDAQTMIRFHALSAAVGVTSIALAMVLPPRWVGAAGFSYGLLGPLHAWHGVWSARRRPR
jgi:uncharacterized membrane protein